MPQHVLIAPLDWGLGHATRCIPIVERYLETGATVYLAGSGASLNVLKTQFPTLQPFELPAYDVQYGKKGSVLSIIKQIPHILRTIRAENFALQRILEKHPIDLVISDNRYGFRAKNTHNIFICHQIAPLPPKGFGWVRSFLFRLHLLALRPFQEVWIPDQSSTLKQIPQTRNPKSKTQHILSGTLSHYKPLSKKFKYIGLLSRFANATMPDHFSIDALNTEMPDVVAVLSGPEPQRTIFEEMLIEQAKTLDREMWLVRGKPSAQVQVTTPHSHLTLISHLETPDMHRALHLAHVVISRSGYSSLMDYAILGLEHLILVPTLGQTEQVYLAEQLALQNIAVYAPQNQFDLSKCLREVEQNQGFA
jgi:predicted glycosyltransferase